MKAKLIYHVKQYHKDQSLLEVKIWETPKSKNRPHGFKYSFAYISGNKRMAGYDNAEGKGDHRHFKGKESPYEFTGLEKLWNDFMKDIQRLKEENS
jgi:hypothetical protein